MGSGRRQAGEEPGTETEGVEGKTGGNQQALCKKGLKGEMVSRSHTATQGEAPQAGEGPGRETSESLRGGAGWNGDPGG